MLGILRPLRDSLIKYAYAVHWIALRPRLRVAPVVLRVERIEQPEPARIIRGLTVKHGLIHLHILEELCVF